MLCARIEEAASRRLVEKSSTNTDTNDLTRSGSYSTDGVTVELTPDGQELRLRAEDCDCVLSRHDAAALRDALTDALTARREFLRTVGVHRDDGSYVVERRGADSSGHRKVFERFESLHRLYDRLPVEFTADDVGRSGLTGGRRHMLVRHFVEHPAFDCSLVSRQPLTVRKAGTPTDTPDGVAGSESAKAGD